MDKSNLQNTLKYLNQKVGLQYASGKLPKLPDHSVILVIQSMAIYCNFGNLDSANLPTIDFSS